MLKGYEHITLNSTKEPVQLIYNSTLTKWVVTSSFAAPVPNATESVAGTVELATQAELEAETATGGSGASLVATPATLKNSPTTVAAWVNFDGIGTVTINDSYNVTSITDRGTGRYTVNIDDNMANTNYAVVYGGPCVNSSSNVTFGYDFLTQSKTAGAINIANARPGSFADDDDLSVAILGDLA